ncbi:glucosaminidase domain-containing protein [uncultured Propionibacterium sp.]|uniref:glucosaminidase domain-containing protein n=1 Tax=uncultured Propionibacterium sp. TaxID=218066 RepID=UPI00292FC531|nr:glucosaminidase domain-containing protein [uncultured Propionibacterium sp.]
MSGRTTLRRRWAVSLSVFAAVTMTAAPLASADPTATPADQNSTASPGSQTGTAEDVSGQAGEIPAEGSEPLENIDTAEAVITGTNSSGLVTSTTIANPSDEIAIKDPSSMTSSSSPAPPDASSETTGEGSASQAGAPQSPSATASGSAEPTTGPTGTASAPVGPNASSTPTTADGTTVLEDIRTGGAGDFSMVGVTWNALDGDGLGLHVRTLTADGWSEWYDITPDQEETEQKATGAIYVEDSTAVEVQATGQAGARAEGMEAVLINTPAQSTDPTTRVGTSSVSGSAARNTVMSTNGSVSQPNMITRSQWGAIAQDGCEANSDTIRAVAVHHTAGSNDYTAGQSASIVRGIQYYHEVTLGWCDIGYNFLVDQYGQIFEGKGGGPTYPVHGAHATTWNWETVGVSLMMNSNTAQPSSSMLNSLEDLIAWKIANNYLNPLGTVGLGGRTINVIFRHGDVMSTECPGTNVTNRMAEIRNAVAARVSGKTYSTIYDTWRAAGGESGAYGVVYEMEHGVTGGRQTNFAHGSIYVSTNGTIYTVHGGIGYEYAALGHEHSYLGLPTSNEVCTLKDGGCYQGFQGGTIHWSTATNAHATHGAIKDEWEATGWENGRLGYPTTDEICDLKDGGCYQNYQGGAILWNQATGAHISVGAIRWMWQNTGFENGSLGYPTSDELTSGSGAYQLFQNGAIVWSSSSNVTKAIAMNPSGLNDQQQSYLRSALPAAVAESLQYNVPVSVALGQSILESGWGGSTLASRYNNYFGIKCSTSSPYQAGCVNMNSGEYINSSYQILSSSFRTYTSATDSFLDHGYFLTHNSRYANAFNYSGDPDEFIRQVARAGYATDPNYSTKVINIMSSYNLYQYNA